MVEGACKWLELVVELSATDEDDVVDVEWSSLDCMSIGLGESARPIFAKPLGKLGLIEIEAPVKLRARFAELALSSRLSVHLSRGRSKGLGRVLLLREGLCRPESLLEDAVGVLGTLIQLEE